MKKRQKAPQKQDIIAILASANKGEVVDVKVSGPMMLPREKELYSVVSGCALRLKLS
jgi:hypothetical protein